MAHFWGADLASDSLSGVRVPRTRGRVGTVLGEKWRVEGALAAGGMASVYVAVNVNTGFRAAVKVLADAVLDDEATKKRFLREGYYANSVDHDGVVSIIDDGVTDDGAPYLIMELLEGETLEERRAAASGKLPFEEVIDVTLSIAEILAAAHDQGLVHRDVKPQNVFLTSDGHVKLLDFGIAGRSQTEDSTRTGAGYGTPMYMAPEQMTGDEHIDARADVFALASTMHRLLSGDFPFTGTNLSEYLTATLRAKPPRLDALVPEVPLAVADVVVRALSAEPDARYADGRAFASAIIKALHDGAPGVAETQSDTLVLQTLKMHADALMRTRVMENPAPPASGTAELPPSRGPDAPPSISQLALQAPAPPRFPAPRVLAVVLVLAAIAALAIRYGR
jgi:serine/threonine-protein kinase